MKKLIYIVIILGVLTSCFDKKTVENKLIDSEKIQSDSLISKQIVSKQKNYSQIKLQENSIDSFPLPFPEKDMHIPLENYYKLYRVKSDIGQQDGPDFRYIEILRLDTPIVYFNFDSENELIINRIIVHDSIITDQYGLSVGNTFEKIKQNREKGKIYFDPYHQHVYYYYENSNISYEINGNLEIPADVKSVEDIIITENDVKDWTIKYIIWRKK